MIKNNKYERAKCSNEFNVLKISNAFDCFLEKPFLSL